MAKERQSLRQHVERFASTRSIRFRLMAIQGIISLGTLVVVVMGVVFFTQRTGMSAVQGPLLVVLGGGTLGYLVLVNIVMLLLLRWLVFKPTRELFDGVERAEYSLRMYEKALQTMDLGVTIVNTEGTIVFSNPAEARMHGYAMDELIGQPARMLAPSHLAKPVSPEQFRSFGSWQRETLNWRKDGTTFPVQLLSDVVRDEEGNPIGLVTFCLDISERKQAELALQQANEQLEARIAERTAELLQANDLMQVELAERKRTEGALEIAQSRLQHLLSAAPAVIYSADPQGKFRITSVSDNIAKMLGYTPRQFMDMRDPWLEGVHPEDKSRVLEELNDLNSKGEFTSEYRFRRSNGRYCWVRDTARRVWDSRHRQVEVVGAWTDITERIQAEETLRKLSRAVEQSTVSIVITDTSGRIEYVNPRWSQLTGYTFEEALGNNPRIQKSGLTSPQVYKELWNTIGHGGEWKGEFTNRKKNGELYIESATISPIVDHLGKITHFVAVKEDITERHRAQQDLAKRANELMTLYETSLTVNAQTNLPDLLHTIIRRAAELTASAIGSLHLMDADGETLRLVVGWRLDSSAIGVTQRPGQGIAGLVALTGEEVVNNDYEHWTGKAEPYARLEVQCVLGVPLKTRQKVIGVIVIANHHREEPFTEEQIRLVRLFADQAAIAVEHARLYSDVQKLAITDELTGIYNRRGLYQFGEREVERARRFRRPLSAIMFDIDHFKWVNDRHSHAAGDQVLRALAECSQKNARHLDILGRYGGEEFVLLLSETDMVTASQVAERLRGSIQNTMVVFEGHEICVTASLGIAELTLAMADLSALISASDMALLAAKDAGRNQVYSAPP